MSFSIHSASAPVFARMLTNLDTILGKVEAWATQNGVDLQSLVDARLADDMLTLSKQVQIATDAAKGALCRMAGKDIPSWEDTEQTFGELRARLKRGIDFANSFSEADLAGAETRITKLRIRGEDVEMIALDFFLKRGLPNFFFHVTTAYDILRHKGVGIGKTDYLGNS